MSYLCRITGTYDIRYNGGMSMQAVGAYLQAVREGRKLSSGAIAARIGTSPTHLWRIEQGVPKSIGVELLIALARAVEANIDDVIRLVESKHATAEDGRRLANAYLSGLAPQQITETRATHGEDRVQLAIDAIQQMTPDELVATLYAASARLRDRQLRQVAQNHEGLPRPSPDQWQLPSDEIGDETTKLPAPASRNDQPIE